MRSFWLLALIAILAAGLGAQYYPGDYFSVTWRPGAGSSGPPRQARSPPWR